MTVSVVIPSYNSFATIRQCLFSLQRQKFSEPFEIICVDSSTDQTPDIIRREFPEVQLIHLAQKTDPGTARNLGVRKARGEVICFIDSDCEAPSNWVATYANLHQKYPDVAAIGGSVKNGNPPGDAIAWAGYIAEFREFLPEHPEGFVRHLPTLNISYKKWVFQRYGYFDPEYYPQEDLVFNHRLVSQGERILFYPSLAVQHHHRSNFRAFLHHQLRIGHITARVLKIVPQEGTFLVQKPWLFLPLAIFLPEVKFWRTINVFRKRNPEILIKNPQAVLLFKAGLFFWWIGFCRGVFSS